MVACALCHPQIGSFPVPFLTKGLYFTPTRFRPFFRSDISASTRLTSCLNSFIFSAPESACHAEIGSCRQIGGSRPYPPMHATACARLDALDAATTRGVLPEAAGRLTSAETVRRLAQKHPPCPRISLPGPSRPVAPRIIPQRVLLHKHATPHLRLAAIPSSPPLEHALDFKSTHKNYD